VHYGTTWDEATLLEEIKQTNLELEKKDGVRRHFHYDWEAVARHNPDYLAYVTAERERLGENHPLFLTQYRLLPIRGGGGFLNPQQRAQLQGEHGRKRQPEKDKMYVAGIDVAGEAEEAEDAALRALKPRQDSTVVTIGEMDFARGNEMTGEPIIKVVEHYWWTGKKHAALYAQLVDILKNVWRCRKIAVDATGIGEPVSSFLAKALSARVVPFTFTQKAKSELGFNLLAAINSGRLKMYRGDSSAEYGEFWREMEQAKSQYRPNQSINFFVDAAKGHDDFLMSLSLMMEAARHYAPRSARGNYPSTGSG
ncbi:MAG: hypothetical protein PHR56_06480, partial [Dehalococcoidales bacterium]|nr:hypothetical protein [Dehalococcoidales bacterium]